MSWALYAGLISMLFVCSASESTGAEVQLRGAGTMAESSSSSSSSLSDSEQRQQQLQAGPPSAPQDITYLLRSLDFFNHYAVKAEREVRERYAHRDEHLQTLLQRTTDEGTRLALEQSETANKQALKETLRVYHSMVSFSGSTANLLKGTRAKGYTCDMLVCGDHSSCTSTTEGAECICNEGYVGKGSGCHAPTEFMPHHLVLASTGGSTMRAVEMSVCVFGRNKMAVAFRDVSRRHVGQIVVGSVREAGTVDLSPPEQFTEGDGMAFSPVVMGTASKRIALAWRDDHRGGAGWIRGAVLGASGIRGADMAISWGDKVNFCQNQAHKMATVSLPGNHLAVLFADRGDETSSRESFGNSLLASIGEQGKIEVLGKFRFTDSAICRLEVTKITPTAFVLAGRASKAVDDLDATISTRQEAMAMYGELVDNDLVFDPNPLNLEPKNSQMWARGLSLIAPNTVAYAYQDGANKLLKMAVIQVDPATHRMQAVQEPTVLRSGFSPYVSMLSVPYTPSDPHTLVYYQDEMTNASMVSLCSWVVAEQKTHNCEDSAWLHHKVISISGVHLGGGRSLFAFAPESGVPYYSIFGLSKK